MKIILVSVIVLAGCSKPVELKFGETGEKQAVLRFEHKEEVKFWKRDGIECTALHLGGAAVWVNCYVGIDAGYTVKTQAVIECGWLPAEQYMFVGNMYGGLNIKLTCI
jgi:hypothetical protein